MEEISFEKALLELEGIVKELENGNVSLDTAIEKYTKAMSLAKLCDERLSAATDKVNKILADNGNLEDFNIEKIDNQ